MLLAGVPVHPSLLGRVAALLDDGEPLRQKLEYEIARRGSIVTLTVQERMALLGALGDDPPRELWSLRDTLLNEFKQRETQARHGNGRQPAGAREIQDA